MPFNLLLTSILMIFEGSGVKLPLNQIIWLSRICTKFGSVKRKRESFNGVRSTKKTASRKLGKLIQKPKIFSGPNENKLD